MISLLLCCWVDGDEDGVGGWLGLGGGWGFGGIYGQGKSIWGI